MFGILYGRKTDSEHTMSIHTPVCVSAFSQYVCRKMLVWQQYAFSKTAYYDEVLMYSLKLT